MLCIMEIGDPQVKIAACPHDLMKAGPSVNRLVKLRALHEARRRDFQSTLARPSVREKTRAKAATGAKREILFLRSRVFASFALCVYLLCVLAMGFAALHAALGPKP